jgi:uncharacterized protein (DUF433 family)
MMIAKQTGKWQNLHMHRESRRRHAKLEGWPDPKMHIATIAEEPDGNIGNEYSDAVVKLLERAAARCPNISIDVNVMQGQPCIFGTRIPVRSVLRVLEQYGSTEEVKRCYPHLSTEQVEDALYFTQIILELPSGLDTTSTATR